MTYRYVDTVNQDGTTCKRPAIPVLFSHGDEKVEIMSLVDSGADMSAIDYRWAELIGLDLSGDKTKSYGVGSEIDTVISRVRIEVFRGHERYSYDIPIRVLFVDDSKPFITTLIGRQGFFDHFKVTIDESQQKVILKYNGQSE
jgi:hypothetical protein